MLKLKKWLSVFCAVIAKIIFSFELLKAKKGFFILHMLRIHTGLRKCSKRNLFYLHLKKINPFGFRVPYIKISKSGLLFEQYRMALNCDKYDIEVRNNYAIKRNQIFFDFMERTFNRLYGLYLCEWCLLIDAIMIYQLRKESAAEFEKLNREKKARNKGKEVTSKPSPKQSFFCE